MGMLLFVKKDFRGWFGLKGPKLGYMAEKFNGTAF